MIAPCPVFRSVSCATDQTFARAISHEIELHGLRCITTPVALSGHANTGYPHVAWGETDRFVIFIGFYRDITGDLNGIDIRDPHRMRKHGPIEGLLVVGNGQFELRTLGHIYPAQTCGFRKFRLITYCSIPVVSAHLQIKFTEPKKREKRNRGHQPVRQDHRALPAPAHVSNQQP